MSDDVSLSVAEEQALLLARAAMAMDGEIAKERRSLHALAEILDGNVRIWVALKTIVSLDGCSLSQGARDNIGRLADFVTARTAQGVETISEETIRSFININLQISEGLLEGASAGD